MAGGRIKGITVEIGGDTTKLQTALKGVNSQIKNTQSQLKDVEKLLKLDPGNTELLSQKQKLLSQSIQETKEKLTTLKTAAEQANRALANWKISQEQYDALQREIIETENELKRLEQQARESGAALQEIAAKGEKLKTIGDYFRCAYRSLAVSYRDALDELEANTGCTYEKLYIVGGGAKNAFLNRLTEEATGKKVIALPIEATALGNFKIQLEVK